MWPKATRHVAEGHHLHVAEGHDRIRVLARIRCQYMTKTNEAEAASLQTGAERSETHRTGGRVPGKWGNLFLLAALEFLLAAHLRPTCGPLAARLRPTVFYASALTILFGTFGQRSLRPLAAPLEALAASGPLAV